MPEGLSNRQLIQGPDISGQANQPARQLGQVSVVAPRGGDTSQAGAGMRALSEMTKMGGKALGGFIEKKRVESDTQAELAAVTGQTFEEFDVEHARAMVRQVKENLQKQEDEENGVTVSEAGERITKSGIIL